MSMRAGKLRYLITIQRQTGATDTTGNETLTWKTYATVWAWIEPYVGSARAGREEFAGSQMVGLDYTRVHLRYLAGLAPKDQILYGTRVFDIQAVNNRDERNAEMELICKERQ
jgi:SPP1 family predicted phage head-tail adaptor